MTPQLPPDEWAQVEALFQEALDLPEDERTPFLDRACPAPLRGEVESLLAAASSELTDAVEAVHRVSDQVVEGVGSVLEGQRLGPYRIEREIGRGGMGVVYLGQRDDDEFDQRVAIKVLPGALFSDETMGRFRNERAILASLEHPNIARLLDGGSTPQGVPYVIMEYVEGVSIDAYVAEHDLDLESRIWLFLGVCDAVQYAHRNLIVHRDLKPGNILVTDDGAPKLLDFGIAKLVTPEDEAEAARTATRIMTPAFASPEQLRGERIGTPSDVYSLGLILYRLLTDELPFSLEDSSPAELSRQIEESEPRLPSDVTANRRLQGDLDTIVLTALRREPERRYGSVGELAADLRRYLTDQPISARPPTWRYRARKFVQRNRAGVAGAAGAVLLVLGFGVAMAIQADRVADQRDNAERAQLRAERASDFLVNLFRQADPNATGGEDLSALELLSRGTTLAREELADEPETQAAVLDMIGRVHTMLARYDTAFAVLEEASEIRRETLGPEDSDYLSTLFNLANLELRRDNYDSAIELYERALMGLRSLHDGPHESIGATLANLANTHRQLGRTAAAESLYHESISVFEVLGNDPSAVLQPMNGLGTLLYQQGQYDSAGVIFARALETQRAVYDGPHEEIAVSLNSLASTHTRRRRFEAADTLLQAAVEMRRQLFGDDHPSTLGGISNLAQLRSQQGRQDEANELLATVVDGFRRRGERVQLAAELSNYAVNILRSGRASEARDAFVESVAISREVTPGHPDNAYALSGLALTGVMAGDTAAAEPLLREALQLRIDAFGDAHRMVAASYRDLGRFLSMRRNYLAADSAFARTVEIFEQTLTADDVDLGRALTDYGRSRLRLEDTESCEPRLQRAVDIHSAALAPDNPELAEAENGLGGCLLLLGRREDAEPLLRRTHEVLEGAYAPTDRRVVQSAGWLTLLGG